MKNIILISCLATSLFAYTQDKRTCGTTEKLAIYQKSNPENLTQRSNVEMKIQDWIENNYKTKSSSITIPVVVHVVYKNNRENISDAQIQSQIDVLNEDFSRTNQDAGNTPLGFLAVASNLQIEFCLAKQYLGLPTNGIIRRQTTVQEFPLQSDSIYYDNLGGSNAWNTENYLNIWICDIVGKIMGWAQMPTGGTINTDGIVVDYESFGTIGTVKAPYHKGRTTTHEVGHWLNLHHPWGDNVCGDDFVADTPEQEKENYGCPTFPSTSNCSNNGSNGDMFMNFMDYSDDACMNMFTLGQKNRILASINLYPARSKLLSSLGCQSITTPTADAGIIEIIQPNNQEVECASPVYAKVIIKNFDANPLYVATIKYSVDGGIEQSQVWNGILLHNEVDTINLSGIPASGTSHTFNVRTTYPNNTTDSNNQNNMMTTLFSSKYGNKIKLQLVTDNYGYETSWKLFDKNYNLIDSKDSLESNTLYEHSFCLEDGCYNFIIYDSYGDGFCCNAGNGMFSIQKEMNDSVLATSQPFTFSDTANFCFSALPASEKNITKETIKVFPNPNNGIFYLNKSIVSENIPIYVKIFNNLGEIVLMKKLHHMESIDIRNQSNGIYILDVTTDKTNLRQKIIIHK